MRVSTVRSVGFFVLVLGITLSQALPCSQTNCGTGKCCEDSTLGGRCYSQDNYDCVSENGKLTLCGKGLGACGSVCFDKKAYNCNNGVLRSGATNTAPTQAPKPATAAPTSAPKPATAAPTSAPKPATAAPTSAPKPATAAPTNKPTPTSIPAASSSVCGGGSCGVGTACCGGQCFNPALYSCPVDSVTKQQHLCPLAFYSCNGKCYDSKLYKCVGNDLQSGAEPGGSPQVPAQTEKPAPVVPNPVPVPIPSNPNIVQPAQKADLRIINNCKTTLWFEARHGNFGEPLPGQAKTATRALPGSYVDYTIPPTGLDGTRFWAKYGCDANGKGCLIGDQMQYYPEGGCPPGGCTPPVDSLFEATWGCKPGTACHAKSPTTWFDTSQVDGWTIPYKLTANGATNGCDCVGTKCGFSGVDASRLDLARCPTGENMSHKGFNTANVAGKPTNLGSVDLRIIDKASNSIIGCMSPCKKINWGLPFGLAQDEGTKPALWMCCPTPDPKNCNEDRGCISPLACRSGPIEQTQFVKAVHDMAPGVYSYSYDDGVGLHACPSGTVTYTMEYCPAGSTQYPRPL